MQLCLIVKFAEGRYHGRTRENKPEWPPSPLRLFQALIAGSHRGAYGIVRADVRDSALRWLERLDPPLIVAGLAKDTGGEFTNFVPNNDDLLDHIRTPKSLSARVINDNGPVLYRWLIDESEEAIKNAAVICAMVSLVTHLGQHQDIVYASGEVTHTEISQEQSERGKLVFCPRKQADGDYESPAEGALEACRSRYHGILGGDSKDDFLIPCHHVRYRPADVIRFDAPLALFELWRAEGKRLRFEPRDLRQPASMTRYAMLEWLDANPVFRDHFGHALTSELIGGHKHDQAAAPHDGAHIGFVPLPSLNERATADGQIRRVLVVGYGCEAGMARELFSDAVGNLNGRLLKDGGRALGTLRRAESVEKDGILQLFIGERKPCRVWRSVTPIILTGMMRRGRCVSQLLLRALRQAGISESDVDSVATFRGPVVPKTLRALDYRVRGYLAETPRYHAEVIFRRPVVGPILIGRGRHSGFGLMLPWLELPSGER